jgi:hypothetical protein
MPVYGKGRTHRTAAEPRELCADAPELMGIRQPKGEQTLVRDPVSGRRALGDVFSWGSKGTSIDKAERKGFPLRQAVRHIVSKQGVEEPVVVDWGCGNGAMVTELKGAFPKARCYGYSREYHHQWDKNESAKFIHAAAGDFARYLKDGSVDLIYSYLGLGHMKADEQAREIGKLIPKLKHGGYMLIDSLKPHAIEMLASREDIDVGMAMISIGIRRK